MRNLLCICCPVGCELSVEVQDGAVLSVSGQQCKRGESYARQEAIAPKRVLTTTVRIKGRETGVLPVRTEGEIPKELLFSCMVVLKDVEVALPVASGAVLVEDICGTGIRVIATRTIAEDVT